MREEHLPLTEAALKTLQTELEQHSPRTDSDEVRS